MRWSLVQQPADIYMVSSQHCHLLLIKVLGPARLGGLASHQQDNQCPEKAVKCLLTASSSSQLVSQYVTLLVAPINQLVVVVQSV